MLLTRDNYYQQFSINQRDWPTFPVNREAVTV